MDKKNKVAVTIYVVVMVSVMVFGPLFMSGDRDKPEPYITFVLGPDSVLDRGYADYKQGEWIIEPANYRWQDEGWGYCLYIYDDCATLKARIVNPLWVNVN